VSQSNFVITLFSMGDYFTVCLGIAFLFVGSIN
jgi:hypothetical protein